MNGFPSQSKRRFHSHRRSARLLAVAAASLASVSLFQTAQAGTPDTWTLAATGNWDTSGNWSGGIPTSTSDATFNTSAAGETITLGSSDVAQGLAIANTMTTNFNGTTLTLGSDGITVNSGSAAFTIAPSTLIIAGSQSWTNNSSAGSTVATVTNTAFSSGSGSSNVILTFTGSGGGGFNSKFEYKDPTGGGQLSLVEDLPGGVTFETQATAAAYTGGTTIKSGNFQVQSNVNSLLNTGTITLGGVGTNNGLAELLFNAGGTISNSINVVSGGGNAEFYVNGAGDTVTFSGPISLAPSTNLLVGVSTGSGNARTLVVSGNISGSGDVTANVSGLVILSGSASSFSGGTTLTTGTLQIGSSSALGTGALTLSGGTLQAASSSVENLANAVSLTAGTTISGSGSLSFGTLTQTNSDTLTSSITSGNTLTLGTVNIDSATGTAQTLTIAGSGTTLLGGVVQDYSGGVGTSHGALTINGTGVAILSGANTYGGLTKISAGTLVAQNASALGTGNVTVAAGAGLNYAAPTDAQLAIGGTLTITGGTGTTIGGSIGSTATSSEIKVTGTASDTAAALTVNVYGINGVTPATGPTTYTLVNGASGSALNTATSLTLGKVYNDTNFTVGALGSTATTITASISAATPLTTAFWTGGLTGATNVWSASSGTASNWAATSGAGVQALVPGSGAAVTISSSSVTTAPTATVLGDNMTVNSLTIADTTNGLGLNADGNALTITPSSSSSGITMNASVPASTIAANVVLGAAQTWTNSSANTLTISGNVSGSSALATTGSGTIILTGANTYSAGTTIGGGTLLANSTNPANGSTGSGLVTVANGGILAGTGIIKGGITVNSGGILTAGTGVASATVAAAPGILNNAGTTTLANGSIFDVKVNNVTGTAGTNWDEVVMNALSVSSTATINLYGLTSGNLIGATPGFSHSSPFTLTIATLATTTQSALQADIPDFTLNTSNFTGNNPINTAGAISLVAVSDFGGAGSDLEIYYNAAPEPTTALLVLAGGLPMLAARRRRQPIRSLP